MKRVICLIFGFIFLSVYLTSQPSWVQVSSTLNEDLVSVCFADVNHGWIISEEGGLTFTTDGGTTWQDHAFSDYHLTSIYFSDNNHGCIVGWQEEQMDSSLILLTNDGGQSWSSIDHSRVNRFNDVYFANNDIGWAVGSQGEMGMNSCYYTDDGGQNWGIQSSPLIVNAQLFGVSFRDELTGSVCGANGAFFITNNGGVSSWAIGISMPIVNLNDIYNFGMLNGCIVGDEGTVLYTINNWYQYIEQTSNTDEDLNAVSGDPDASKLWAVGDNGTIIYSPNYLLGWTVQNSGVTEDLNDVHIISEANGWAVGDNGTILHLTTPVTIESHQINIEAEIYPNPVKNILYISFSKNPENTGIEIYSARGQLVYKIHDIRMKNTSINVSNWPAGVYFLRIGGSEDNNCSRIVIK